MPFTDRSDLYGAIHEEGINLTVQHIMRQRPSLFNYGTARVRDDPEFRCQAIDTAKAVIDRGNPLITLEDPLPVVGTNGRYGLDFCVQFTRMELDFYPGNVITLPPELRPPLAEQRFALRGTACAGIACPANETIQRLVQQNQDPRRDERTIVIPAERLLCFCLDLTAVGSVQVVGPRGAQRLQAGLDGIEIVDIQPAGLENSIECYISLLIQLVILPRINVALPKLVFDLLNLGKIVLFATPTSPALPNNPAIEADQLKVFINVEVPA